MQPKDFAKLPWVLSTNLEAPNELKSESWSFHEAKSERAAPFASIIVAKNWLWKAIEGLNEICFGILEGALVCMRKGVTCLGDCL